MSRWNYRVMRYAGGELGIHEVCYDSEGKPSGWTDRAVGVVGADLDGLRMGLVLMTQAFDKPILEYT